MNIRKQFKRDAKRALANNWGKAIAIVLLMISIFMFFSIIDGILNIISGIGGYHDFYNTPYNYLDDLPDISLVSLVITSVLSLGMFLIVVPLNLGITSWYYRLSEGESEDILSIFNYFSSAKMFFRSLWMVINLLIRGFFWHILIFLPAYLSCFGGYYSLYILHSIFSPALATIAYILSVIFGIAGVIIFAIVVNKYFLVKYYILAGDTTVFKAFKLSAQNMKGFKASIFWFRLSFIGWFIISLCIIPLLFVLPYYEMSSVLYARYIMEYSSRRQKLVAVQTETSVLQENMETSETESLHQTYQEELHETE